MAVGLPVGGSPRIRRGARQLSVQPVAEQALEPGLVLVEQARPGPACSGPGATRRAWRIASASSRSGAIVAPPPHGARTTNPPSEPSSRDEDPSACPGARTRGSRCARSSPVAARSSAVDRRQVRGFERPDPRIGRSRRRARAPRGSGTRSGPRSRAARTAAGPHPVATRTSVRQPAASAASIVAWVSARPRPCRRHAGSTQIVPIQATGAVDGHDAGPDDRAVGVGDDRMRLRVAGREVEVRAGDRPSRRAAGRRRPGRRRRASSAGSRDSSPADRSGRVGYHRAHGHPVPRRCRARRPPRPPRADRRRADRLEGELNHILDQYAILAELPTDDIPPTAQTIELENILRDDVVRPSLPVEAVLANAPARDGDFIVVPAILDER